MADARVTIDASALERVTEAGVSDLIQKGLDAGVASARRLVPIDTGELQSRIGIIDQPSEGRGSYGVTGNDYWEYVEFGTGRGPEQPFLRPSIDAVKQALQ